MYESSFGVHKIEFMINSGENFSNSSRVRDHAYSSHNFSEITTWDNGWWLIIDTTFETSWAPIDKLDSSFVLIVATEAFTSFGTTSPL